MKKVYVYLADGFEEIEALTPVDLLRRAGADVVTLSVSGSKTVVGAHNIPVTADALATDTDISDADMIVLPGGYPGYVNLGKSEAVLSAVKYMYQNKKYIAAICGAPAEILGKNGFASGISAACYPGTEADMKGADLKDADAVISGNIITGRAAGAAVPFALLLITALFGKQTSDKIKAGIVYNG